MSQVSLFEQEKRANIKRMAKHKKILRLSNDWIVESGRHKYSYNFSWLGRPIIQYPQDMIAMQEISA